MLNVNAGATTQTLVTEPDRLNRLVRLEQTRMVFNQLPTSMAGIMAGAITLTAMLWSSWPSWQLLTWLSFMLASQSWRLTLYIKFRRNNLSLDTFERWARYWAISSGVIGCGWGAASILFFVPDSPLHQSLLTVLVFAISAGAVPVISSHAQSFYIYFFFPTLLPLVGLNIWEGQSVNYFMAFIISSFIFSIMLMGRNHHLRFSKSLLTQFENEALAQRLTEQNAELKQARNIAELANRAKTQFFAAASHDLRQPLHAMGLFASALCDKVRDPEVRQAVDSINTSVIALESLFSELLDISRIDAGAVRLNIGDFALEPLLIHLRVNLAAEAEEKGLELRIHVGDVFVRSDQHVLERILRNLICNAIRYTPRGGILVGARKRGNNVRIEVWDTGVGIDADQYEKVFDEFYQLGNPERDRKKGLGLGLSIVRRLSLLIGHPLSLLSRPGRGTVFRLDVPIATGPILPPAPVMRNNMAPDLVGYLVIVIDDDLSIREGMTTILTGWGAQTLTCASLAEALHIAKTLQQSPDLLIVDFHLPEGGVGHDAIRSLRQQFKRDIPAIMITGSVTPERIAEAKLLGYHLLQKPVMPAKLRTLIHSKLHEAGLDPQ